MVFFFFVVVYYLLFIGYHVFTPTTSDADIGANAVHTFSTNHTEGKFGVRNILTISVKHR